MQQASATDEAQITHALEHKVAGGGDRGRTRASFSSSADDSCSSHARIKQQSRTHQAAAVLRTHKWPRGLTHLP